MLGKLIEQLEDPAVALGLLAALDQAQLDVRLAATAAASGSSSRALPKP